MSSEEVIKKMSICVWKNNGEDTLWDTECGETFVLNEGTPEENGMKYCCYCGKLIEEGGLEE